MIEAVAEEMGQAGFKAVEVPVIGIYFKKFVRDLKEDPWEMARMVARKMPTTVKACMAGGGFHPFEAPPPRAIMKLFYERLAAIGALNRAQMSGNTFGQMETAFPWLIPLFRELGLQVVIALSYTISPRHTDEYYAQKTRQVVQFKPDVIYLKDQGGLLTPDRVRTLVPVILENAGGVPVELHSHCTTGLADLVYLEALKLGIRTLHTAVPPLANGSSQPSVFNVARNARLLGFKTAIHEERLRPVRERLTAIAKMEKLPIGAPLEYDYAQYIHQVPGGVISNLKHQLAELQLQHRLDEVLEECVQIRKELGYPIMITPHSQFVVTQAAINVALGERWKIIVDEIILFAMGVFGEDSGYTWMDQNLKDKILSLHRAKELADRGNPTQTPLKEIRESLGGPGVSDEELLLRFIMKGEQEIQAMRAAGPPKQYSSATTPLLTLLKELSKNERPRYIHIQKGGESLVLQRRSSG
jgi:oxaloacetate decarboxylase alpha subunit